jgi:hypothetical protein
MIRAIILCGLLAACHAPAGDPPQPVQIETWEVTNGSPCDAHVQIRNYTGQLVQKLGIVAPETSQTFRVLSTLTRGNSVSAVPVEADGTSLCRNNQNLEKKVIVRKLSSSSEGMN